MEWISVEDKLPECGERVLYCCENEIDNGLCASLTCLMRNNFDPDNHKNMILLIYNTLNKNL